MMFASIDAHISHQGSFSVWCLQAITSFWCILNLLIITHMCSFMFWHGVSVLLKCFWKHNTIQTAVKVACIHCYILISLRAHSVAISLALGLIQTVIATLQKQELMFDPQITLLGPIWCITVHLSIIGHRCSFMFWYCVSVMINCLWKHNTIETAVAAACCQCYTIISLRAHSTVISLALGLIQTVIITLQSKSSCLIAAVSP